MAPGGSLGSSLVSPPSRQEHRSSQSRRSVIIICHQNADEGSVDRCLEQEVGEVHACWREAAALLGMKMRLLMLALNLTLNDKYDVEHCWDLGKDNRNDDNLRYGFALNRNNVNQ